LLPAAAAKAKTTVMLCRVLGKDWSAGDSSGIELPPWLLPESPNRTNAPESPGRTNGNDRRQAGPTRGASAEVQQLRSQVEELTSLVDRGTKDAQDQGFRAGEMAARRSLEAELRETVSALAKKIAEIAAQGPEIIRRAEADTVRLAIEIARRVLHREITVDPSALSALVGAALEKLRNQEIHCVRIHPDLEKLLKSSLEQFGRSAAIEVLPDPALPRGGVTFEISRGSLDASVDTQLREIERGLVDEIRTRS
jgi:flagellar assembly protein FliH